MRAVVVAGALAIAATAWIGRDLSQLAAQPVVFGLAYLAFALAVAIRFGAIPFHLWAARLTDAVPETALPIVTALAPASLAIVALAWTDASIAPLLVDVERGAAVRPRHRDRLDRPGGRRRLRPGRPRARRRLLDRRRRRGRHARPRRARSGGLGAGPDLDPRRSSSRAARSRPGPAGVRAGFWTGRIADLRGWVCRSPLLAVAFALVVIACVGLPGLAAFDARRSIVDLALDGPLSSVVLLATLAPLAYYGSAGRGRPGAAGPCGRSARAVDAAADPALDRRSPALGRRGLGGKPGVHDRGGGGPARPARARDSAGGFGGPEAAAGLPPALSGPGEIVAPIDVQDLPQPIESLAP